MDFFPLPGPSQAVRKVNAEPPYNQAKPYGLKAFPEEVSRARQGATRLVDSTTGVQGLDIGRKRQVSPHLVG